MNLKNKIKYLGITLTLASILGYSLFKKISNTLETEKDFKKADWGKYENIDRNLWKEYMNENINKSSWNWENYVYYTQLINNGNLEETIWLPDLDKNDSIGKTKPKEWKSGKELFDKINYGN